MKMDQFIRGTCESMCSEDEIAMRTRERLLHYFERDHAAKTYAASKNRVITEFSRSAAGTKSPRKQDLRSPTALWITVTYLMEEYAEFLEKYPERIDLIVKFLLRLIPRILPDDRKPFNVVYDFIFDRLRAVRQEIVIQNLDTIETIHLLEPIVLFLAYSAYRLVNEPFDRYDPKICHQHLQECLKKILTCYDELDMATTTIQYSHKNREFIESLYLLLNIGQVEALARMLQVPVLIRNHLYSEATRVSIAFWNGNMYKCADRMKKLPHILSAVASLKIQTVRREILLRFSVAYHSRTLTVPLNWLKKILSCSDTDEVIGLCKYYNISCDAATGSVKFNRPDFDLTRPILKSCHERFVDDELENLNVPIPKILTLKDLCTS